VPQGRESRQLTIYIHERWGAKVDVPDDLWALAQFLESDLQNNIKWAQEVETRLAKVREGVDDRYEREGNCVLLVATEAKANLEYLFGSDRCALDVGVLEDVVRAWRMFQRNATRRAPVVTVIVPRLAARDE
jgi:hypothetical protein